MLTAVAFIALGIPIGFALRKNRAVVHAVDKLTMWAIYLLLFLLGISLGTDDNIVSQAGNIGIKAFLISAACVAGSALAAWLLGKVILKGGFDER
ncbi:LysO family transporter [Oleidesulfovibrio sp.]|uniref:LysO family transporter n=1 Tax=Oleidesulfovibrio sp. TaxID=2909707 RepID=UPI003A879FE1